MFTPILNRALARVIHRQPDPVQIRPRLNDAVEFQRRVDETKKRMGSKYLCHPDNVRKRQS